MSPRSIQLHLSVAQERRLIEQSKRFGPNSKREQDINFFLTHIKKQGGTSRPKKNQSISGTGGLTAGPLSQDLAYFKAQVLLNSQASHLAGSAYLPSKLKNTLKQRQLVSQVKTME